MGKSIRQTLKILDITRAFRIYSYYNGHTFATRQVETGINLKVIQETLGHADIKTTLNIYVEATEELKSNEFDKLQVYLEIQNKKGSV